MNENFYFTCRCPPDIQRGFEKRGLAHLVPIDCTEEGEEADLLRKMWREEEDIPQGVEEGQKTSL